MTPPPSDPGRRRLYLASPYGFSAHWRQRLLPDFVAALEALGLEVWEPFARNGQMDLAQPGWAWRVAQADLQDVRDADGLLAIVNGTPPDEGVMLELGAAIALGKPVFLFRDDFRRCSDSEDYPLNLMVFSGLPQHGWQDWLYSTIEELADPAKALVRWLTRYRIERDDGLTDAIAGACYDSYDAAHAVLERYVADLCCSDDRCYYRIVEEGP